MSVALPKIRVGDPLRHESLSIFPLFSETPGRVDYRLADDALADQTLSVEEVDEDGSVPYLIVENKGDMRVLFLEGEELIGAKQNRILNTSVLVGAHGKTKVPVSCVERGRWHYQSRHFGSSGSHAPSKLRRTLKASVSKSIKEKLGHKSDQAEVWSEVEALHACHGVNSGTDAMSDAFEGYKDRISAFQEKLPYIENATGIAVAIGDRVASVDLFDKPATCQKVWNRMLTGIVFDALEAGETSQNASVSDVEHLIAKTGALPWEQSESVGEGTEYRAESSDGDHASALALEQTIVHGSVLTGV
jgi:hypothetical protein